MPEFLLKSNVDCPIPCQPINLPRVHPVNVMIERARGQYHLVKLDLEDGALSSQFVKAVNDVYKQYRSAPLESSFFKIISRLEYVKVTFITLSINLAKLIEGSTHLIRSRCVASALLSQSTEEQTMSMMRQSDDITWGR